MKKEQLKSKRRWRRHKHLRRKLVGTSEKPRLAVFRSANYIYCQVIDDTFVDAKGNRSGKTIVGCSSRNADIKKNCKNGGNIEAARLVGAKIAELAKEKGVTKVAFDRGGYLYHGRVKALADAAREAGLQF